MMTLPSNIRLAVADPKSASNESLLSTINFYDEAVSDDDLDLVRDEFIRRGGDPDYAGTMEAPSWEAYL